MVFTPLFDDNIKRLPLLLKNLAEIFNKMNKK